MALHLLLLGKDLSTINEAALSVLSAVDEVRVIESQLNSAIDNVVNSLDTKHERVILVTDLVAPASETATRPDALLLKLGEKLSESALTLQRWGGVTVVESAVVSRDDLVTGLEHLSVNETLDGFLHNGLKVHRLVRGLRDFQHNGPVGARLGLTAGRSGTIGELLGGELLGGVRLVVGGVVGEDGGTVEGTVVLGEVKLVPSLVDPLSVMRRTKTYPALVSNALRTLSTNTNPNDVGGRVEELLGVVDELLVTDLLAQGINSHGGDELLVTDGGTIGQSDNLRVGVHLSDLSVLTEASLLLGESVGDGNPDTTGTVTGRETEGSIRTPVTGSLVQDDVGGHSLDIRGGDTLTEPSALHLEDGSALLYRH